MNIAFLSVDTKEEIFNVESPSLDDAYERVKEYFGDMSEYEGDYDLMNFDVTEKRPNAWVIKNTGTGGTYLLYIKK